ncbi:MAG TPA: CAP domain-containing protein [Polyangia bacterium]|nr:CAP domain-containing protein [Polyangia bacterium]
MRGVALALAMIALPACGMLSSGSNGGGGGSGGGGSGGGGGGGSSNADAHVQHNVDVLNMYRAQAGAAPLVLDDQLSTFSTTASNMLESTGQAHGYFMAQIASMDLWNQGFCGSAAENQAPGWPINGGDEDATIDAILKAMMDEGPGGGHHDNILASSSTRVGVGLVVDAQQQLWFTNDFSGPCQ